MNTLGEYLIAESPEVVNRLMAGEFPVVGPGPETFGSAPADVADDYKTWVDVYTATPGLVSWVQDHATAAPRLYRGMFFDNAEEREAWTAKWVSGGGYTTLADGFSGVEAYSVEQRVADKIANTTAENYEDGVGVVFQIDGLRAADMAPLADWFKSEREWLVADRQQVTFDRWEDSPDGTIRTFYGHVGAPDDALEPVDGESLGSAPDGSAPGGGDGFAVTAGVTELGDIGQRRADTNWWKDPEEPTQGIDPAELKARVADRLADVFEPGDALRLLFDQPKEWWPFQVMPFNRWTALEMVKPYLVGSESRIETALMSPESAVTTWGDPGEPWLYVPTPTAVYGEVRWRPMVLVVPPGAMWLDTPFVDMLAEIGTVARWGTPEADRMLNLATAAELVHAWAESATAALSVALAAAAVQTVPWVYPTSKLDNWLDDTKPHEIEELHGGEGWDPGDVQEFLNRNPVVGAVAQTIYDDTQAWLADHGIDEITLFRGMHGETVRAIGTGPEVTELDSNPLSSWSFSYNEAANFADPKWLGHEDTDQPGLIVEATIPAARIFSIPHTGIGAHKEAEMVVLGGTHPVLVRSYWGTSYDEDPEDETLGSAPTESVDGFDVSNTSVKLNKAATPPAPGRAAIPVGATRLYHVTGDHESLQSILNTGLSTEFEGTGWGRHPEYPGMVWASTVKPDGFDPFVEFWMDPDEFQGSGDVTRIAGGVPPGRIVSYSTSTLANLRKFRSMTKDWSTNKIVTEPLVGPRNSEAQQAAWQLLVAERAPEPVDPAAGVPVGQVYSYQGIKILRTASGFINVATGEPVDQYGVPL
jgi:hypothetical protein